VKFDPKIIDIFLKSTKEIKDFIIFAPQHESSLYKKEFYSDKINNFQKLKLMKYVHGHFLFFNMRNVKKIGFFDEKIFLYYEETDFCLRAYRKNQKIYVFPKIKVFHESGKSVEIKDSIEIEANKNWHFMWSKFYFYKKNFSKFQAYRNTIYDLLESIIKFTIFLFFNKRRKIIFYNRISGLINSYKGETSFRRLKF
jgi:GT2 family glycosyltransferase